MAILYFAISPTPVLSVLSPFSETPSATRSQVLIYCQINLIMYHIGTKNWIAYFNTVKNQFPNQNQIKNITTQRKQNGNVPKITPSVVLNTRFCFPIRYEYDSCFCYNLKFANSQTIANLITCRPT